MTALRGCGERGIRAAAILSGGFAESGAEGAQRQQELLQIARSFDMRLIGPNCVGVLDAYSRLNATFIEQMPSPGVIAFLSQSGAMGGALIDWAKGQGIGLSHFASLGNTVDVDEADLIAYLAADEHAGAIALYIEGLNDGRRFMQMAVAASRRKPILALKAGGTAAGARAVASHTAHLAGSAQGYAAAFRQSGVIQVHTAAELFAAALGLAYQPPPAGDNVAILTNAGGPGALAADALARAGLAAPEPDAATRSALRAALGPAAQLANPIDMLGAASTPEYEAAGRVLLASPTYDALLVLLVPNTVTDPVGIADALQRLQAEQSVRKPIFVCAMGGISIAAGMRRLHRHRIPPFAFPETAARALAVARGWQRWRLSPPESPLPSPPALPAAVQQALQAHLQGGRAALGESDLIHLLQPLGFPFPPGCLAATPAAAAACAGQIGRPVALKIVSPDLLHKSDAGGVRLHVAPAAAGRGVRRSAGRSSAAAPAGAHPRRAGAGHGPAGAGGDRGHAPRPHLWAPHPLWRGRHLCGGAGRCGGARGPGQPGASRGHDRGDGGGRAAGRRSRSSPRRYPCPGRSDPARPAIWPAPRPNWRNSSSTPCWRTRQGRASPPSTPAPCLGSR